MNFLKFLTKSENQIRKLRLTTEIFNSTWNIKNETLYNLCHSLKELMINSQLIFKKPSTQKLN